MSSTPYSTIVDPKRLHTPGKLRQSIDYMHALNYVSENPNWMTNVGLAGLCLFSTSIVPVVGHLVLIGYQFAIIERLHLRPDETYPDFDFDEITSYLTRGAWVFIASLAVAVMTLPVTGLVMGLFVMAILSGAALGGDDGAGIAAVVAMPAFIVLTIGVSLAACMLMTPFLLRAGLTQDLGKTFDFGFAKQFVRNTWKEMLIGAIVLFFAMLILEVIGIMAFCIGVFFTMGLGMMMHAHLGLQLYELHLARGGDPIEIRSIELEAHSEPPPPKDFA